MLEKLPEGPFGRWCRVVVELRDDPIVCRLLNEGSVDPSDLSGFPVAIVIASDVERERLRLLAVRRDDVIVCELEALLSQPRYDWEYMGLIGGSVM